MRPDKRLGQHFLVDPEVLGEIAAIADVERTAGVLEIGPGEGALTAFLLRAGPPVVALEKDPRAILHLQERFGDQVALVQGDALQVDLAELLPPPDAQGRLPVVVGNLPYNVGSAIYRRLLTLRGRVARLVLMLQKEVAQRIVATAGGRHYGIPSVVTALTARAWMVQVVPPRAFRPRPKVDSAVILVEFRDDAELGAEETAAFDRFVARIFRHRRKTLVNAFAEGQELLERGGIDPTRRPESLTPQELLTLYQLE